MWFSGESAVHFQRKSAELETSLGTFKLRGPARNEGMKLYMVMLGMKLPSFQGPASLKITVSLFLFAQITFFLNFSLCSGKKYNLYLQFFLY